MKCFICSKKGIFKIKGEDIFYCKDCAKKFFSPNCLELIKNISKINYNAKILKNIVDKNK